MFNSNSPEWPKSEGILLSTFPPQGKKVPAAHLNYAFSGPFTLFTHHFSHTPKNLRTLYLGLLVHNPNPRSVTITIPAAASYLMSEAPFQRQPQVTENPDGKVFSGHGIRAVDNILRGQRHAEFPAQLTVAAGGYQLLMNHPIPVRGLPKPINGRSTFMRLKSTGAIYIADLAMYAPQTVDGAERPPTLAEWHTLLNNNGLAGPRDKTPTPPNQTSGPLIYSRVAGVQRGSTWKATLTDPGQTTLKIPANGQGIAYALSTLRGGRLGTGQSQSAPLMVRYPDTAHEAHGNYGVHYDLSLPLYNSTEQAQIITVTLASPFKQDQLSSAGLRFIQPPPNIPFFRGTVRLKYSTQKGQVITRYVHLWQRKAELMAPLLTLTLPPRTQQPVHLDFLYPPDSTPPQVLRIENPKELPNKISAAH
jgi:hypothetical protein